MNRRTNTLLALEALETRKMMAADVLAMSGPAEVPNDPVVCFADDQMIEREDIGPTDQRPDIGPTDQRQDIGPSEWRQDVGPSEWRQDIGPTEWRQDIGPSEWRQDVGPSDQRPDVGPTSHRPIGRHYELGMGTGDSANTDLHPTDPVNLNSASVDTIFAQGNRSVSFKTRST